MLSPGAWLAGLLAIASVAVLAGGRMAEHTRRVGLLKAVGGTPGWSPPCCWPRTWSWRWPRPRPGCRRLAGRPADHQPRGRTGRHPRRAVAHPPTAGLAVAVALVVALAATLVPGGAGRPDQHGQRAGRLGPPAATLGPAHRDVARGCRCRCCSGCGWPPGGRAAPC